VIGGGRCHPPLAPWRLLLLPEQERLAAAPATADQASEMDGFRNSRNRSRAAVRRPRIVLSGGADPRWTASSLAAPVSRGCGRRSSTASAARRPSYENVAFD
jgi:hypothetical protein